MNALIASAEMLGRVAGALGGERVALLSAATRDSYWGALERQMFGRDGNEPIGPTRASRTHHGVATRRGARDRLVELQEDLRRAIEAQDPIGAAVAAARAEDCLRVLEDLPLRRRGQKKVTT